MSLDEAGERLLEGLDESVRLRLMSDVPLGAMLSGGIDSSVIVALMARHMTEPVKTFSIGFAEAGERQRARRRAARRRSTSAPTTTSSSFRSHEQTVDLAELVWFMDEPLADLSALGFLALSELAAQHVTVALSGQGADELLGGYRKHRAAAIAGYWTRLPRQPFGPRELQPAACARAVRAVPRARSRPATRPTRLLAMSANVGRRLRARARPRPARRAGRWRRAAHRSASASAAVATIRCRRRSISTGSSGSSTTCSTTSTAPRWRTRSRCAFRSSTTSSSSSARPSRRSTRFGGSTTKHVLKHAVRGLIPDRDHRQAEGRLLQRRRRRVVPRADARARSATTCSGPIRGYAEMLDRGRGRADSSRSTQPGARHGNGVRPALDSHARGLAVVIPAALALDRRSRPAERLTGRMTVRTQSSRRRGRGGESARLARLMPGASRFSPRAWTIVDNGSTDGTLELAHADRGRARIGCMSLSIPGASAANRGAPIVRALQARHRGDLETIRLTSSSTSMPTSRWSPTTSSSLLERFDADPSLGIASGSAFEARERNWRAAPRHGHHRLGRLARVSLGVPPGDPSARGACGLGRARRVQGKRTRLAAQRRSRSFRFAITGVKGSATVRLGRPAGIREAQRTISAIGSGTSFFVPLARSPRAVLARHDLGVCGSGSAAGTSKSG